MATPMISEPAISFELGAVLAAAEVMWEHRNQFLVCGDAEETLRTFPSGSVDVVFADPPFFGSSYRPRPEAERLTDERMMRVFAECWRVAEIAVFWYVPPGYGTYGVAPPSPPTTGWDEQMLGPVPSLTQVIAVDTGPRLGPRSGLRTAASVFVYTKPGFLVGDLDAANPTHEWRSRRTVSSVAHPFHTNRGLFRQGTDPQIIDLCLRIPVGVRSVLDPFVGIGTSLLVAQEHGVVGIGIEARRDVCIEACGLLDQVDPDGFE